MPDTAIPGVLPRLNVRPSERLPIAAAESKWTGRFWTAQLVATPPLDGVDVARLTNPKKPPDPSGEKSPTSEEPKFTFTSPQSELGAVKEIPVSSSQLSWLNEMDAAV